MLNYYECKYITQNGRVIAKDIFTATSKSEAKSIAQDNAPDGTYQISVKCVNMD